MSRKNGHNSKPRHQKTAESCNVIFRRLTVLGGLAVVAGGIFFANGSDSDGDYPKYLSSHQPYEMPEGLARLFELGDGFNFDATDDLGQVGIAQEIRKAELARLQAEVDYMAQEPPLLNPNIFNHGDFVGALVLNYQSGRNSQIVRSTDSLYRQYFGEGNFEPPSDEQVYLRISAMFDINGMDRLLEKGAILDTITTPRNLVVGVHNISEISSIVNVNGTEHVETRGGGNGLLDVGDTAQILMSDPNLPGVMIRYTYELQKENDIQVVPFDSNIENYIYEFGEEGEQWLTMYWCYPPGSEEHRVVIRLRLAGAERVRGYVAEDVASSMSPTNPDI